MRNDYSKLSDDLDMFLKELKRIGAKSSYYYRKNKGSDSPSWEFVAKTCGVKGWEGLCDFLNLPKLSSRNNKDEIVVESHTKLEQDIKNIELKYKK